MKKYLLTSLLLFFGLLVNAQQPKVIAIDSVSVNRTDNTVWISWTPDTTENLDGYYIFRYIYQGNQSVLPGAVPKIDTIRAPATTVYEDNQAHYGEITQPEIRPERYGVAALKGDQHSLMSAMHATMHLKPVAFDSCNARNQLTWTRYSGWDSTQTEYLVFSKKEGENLFHQIGTSGRDTTFTHAFLDAQTTYHYYIKARHTQTGFTSSSNEQQVFTRMPTQPNLVQADYATVNDAGNIALQFRINPSASVSYYALQHTTDTTKVWETVKQVSTPSDPLVFEQPVSVFQQHYYRLLVVNACGVEYKISGILQNSVLQVQTRPQNTNQVALNWTAQNSWPDSVVTYKIFKQQQNGNFTEIGQTTDLSYTWTASGSVSNADHCFYVVAENAQTGFQSRTNTACATEEAIIGMPNAFNPESTVTENRSFKPVVNYVDSYLFQIYDRWGSVVFETQQPSKGWKGKINGTRKAPEGVYVYKIRYSKNGETFHKSGTVTLLR